MPSCSTIKTAPFNIQGSTRNPVFHRERRLEDPLPGPEATQCLSSHDCLGVGFLVERTSVRQRISIRLETIVTATLLAEASETLQRRAYQVLRCLSGVAPVTKRSGKSCIVLTQPSGRRPTAQCRLPLSARRRSHDPVCKARHKGLRERGHDQARSLRPVAGRLLSVACAMLKSRSISDPKLTAEAA